MTVELAVTRWGAGRRRALLLHGLSSNAAGWWRLGPDLAGEGFAVTAPDLRGHGHSPRAEDYSIASYADDVLALGDGWDLVLGHSLGGAAAVSAASRRAGWAQQVVLEDPALHIADPGAALDWLLEPFAGPMTPESVAAGNPRWPTEDCAHKADALRQSGAEVVRGTVEDNTPWDLRAAVAAIGAPTLIIGAAPELGGLMGPSEAEALPPNPAVAYTLVPGAGHSIHRDDYEAFFATLRAFG